MAATFVTSDQVWVALRLRFPAPRYATMAEVRDSTGISHKRTADAIIVNLWGSDGHEIQGVETKVSRSDFLQELKDPTKASAIFQYCDRFWLAVGDPDIVKEGELPVNWGLLVPKGKSLVVAKPAPKLEPVPITRKFLGGLMRAAEDQLSNKREVEIMLRSEYERGRNDGNKRSEQTFAELKKKIEEQAESMRKISAAIGECVGGYSWNWHDFGKFVQLYKNVRHREDIGRYCGQEIDRHEAAIGCLKALREQLRFLPSDSKLIEQDL